jgi:hypothetical protein
MSAEAAEAGPRSVAVRDPYRARSRKTGAAKDVGRVKPRLMQTGYVAFLTIADLDQRTRAAMRVRELTAAIEADLGGADRLSTSQRQLVQRGALLAVALEDFEIRFACGQAIEFGDYLLGVNTQRRVLATLGLERRARDVTPSLREYLAEKAEATP